MTILDEVAQAIHDAGCACGSNPCPRDKSRRNQEEAKAALAVFVKRLRESSGAECGYLANVLSGEIAQEINT